MKKIFFAVIAMFLVGVVFARDMYFIEYGDTIFLTPERGTRSGDDGWLTTQHGHRVKVDKGIIVTLKNGQNASVLFAKYPIKSYERLSNNIFLLIPDDESKQFELSRELLKSDSVESSHPNLIREKILR
jgi:hypothetical protein